MASGKERIWSRQTCKERQKIPEKAQKWAQFLPSPWHSILHIKCKMYIFCKGCSLSYSSVLQNKDTQLGACTSPSRIWLMSKQSILVIPVSLHLHFPCQVLEIHFSHQLLGWGASTQPPLATKDAKLSALTFDYFFLCFSKFTCMFTWNLKAPLTDQFWDTDIMYCYLKTTWSVQPKLLPQNWKLMKTLLCKHAAIYEKLIETISY